MCAGNMVSSSDVVIPCDKEGEKRNEDGRWRNGFPFLKSPEEKEIQYGQGSESVYALISPFVRRRELFLLCFAQLVL
jgi:hypothetical protein